MLIHPYQEKWPADFLLLKNILTEALKNLTISIEHVGSTAIPGLAAKPIIDIDIIYSTSDFDMIREGLETIGYYHNGNQGIPNREVFKRTPNSEDHAVLDLIHHHLYACPIDSQELKRHLSFRNHLRKNQDARQKYQDIKYQIAEAANQDPKLYAKIKETQARSFIESCIEKETDSENLSAKLK